MLIDSPESTGSIIISGSLIPEATGTNNGIHDIGSLQKPFRDLFITTSSLNFVRDGMIVSVINGGDDYIQVGNIIIGTSSISYASGSAGTLQNIITVDTGSSNNMVTFESPDGEDSSYTGSFSGSFHGNGSRLTGIISTATASHVADAYISSSVVLNTITFTNGDKTTDTVIVHTGSAPDGTISGSAQVLASLPAGTVSSSAQIESVIDDDYISASAATSGFGSGGGGGAGLSATDIANISGAFDSGSVAGNVLSLTTLGGDTTSYTIDTGSGGGGGATDISSLNTFTGSADGRLDALQLTTGSLNTFTGSASTRIQNLEQATGSFLGNADTGSYYISSSVDSSTITFTQGDGTTDTVTVAGGGGGSSVTTAIFNTNYRYYVTITPTSQLQLQSSGDYFYDRSWNRSGTTINVTSSAHGLGTGDVVALRNSSEDNVIAAVTNIDTDHFSMDVANSGGTTGTAAGYVPLFSGSITETSGDVTAVTITAPGALSGSAQLKSFQIYGSNMESSPMQVTLPAGENEGAGLFGSKLGINLPHVTAVNLDGTGNSSNVTVSPQLNLGSSFNVLRLNGVDNFSSMLIKCSYY